MSARLNPGDCVLLRHVGRGVWGVKEKHGRLNRIVTVRDEFGTTTRFHVSAPGPMVFGTDNRQIAPISEWRLDGKAE